MKTNALVTFFVLILLLQNIYSQKTLNAEITYIGNEGFMIKNNDKKLFVDALYWHYRIGDGVVSMDTSVENMIIKGTEPFLNSQLFLVTHNHPDHYEVGKVNLFLTNNPSTKLVAPSTVTNDFKDEALQKQLVCADVAKFKSIDTTVNDMQISFYNLMHNKAYGSVYNSGYYVNLDGLKILHTGDNVTDDTTEIINYKFYEKNIDFAFLSYCNSQRELDFVKKYINPKYIILMHLAPESVIEAKELVKNFIPPVIVFSGSMEKLKITDTITFVNRMPEMVMSVSDTILKINTFFEFKVPNIFKDPDINDSLSYSITGLPAGLNFDSVKMIISGTPAKVGKFVPKITAKDKSLCSNIIDFKITIVDKTNIVNTKQSNIIVYPTVFNNEINVTNLNSNSKISVFTMDGILLKVIQTQDSAVQIDLSNLSIGSYIVRIENKTAAYSKRIIKLFK